MTLNTKATEPYNFKIIIKGTAKYDPTSQDVLSRGELKKFDCIAQDLLNAYKLKLKELFENELPLLMNPIIDGEINFRGVANEEDENP